MDQLLDLTDADAALGSGTAASQQQRAAALQLVEKRYAFVLYSPDPKLLTDVFFFKIDSLFPV